VIAKHVTMKSLKKNGFAGLVKYLLDSQNKSERVGTVTVTNCHSSRPDVAITEILNTHAKNTRAANDKTYHLIISFRPGEQPLDATLKAVEARICDALGFGGHQRVSAVHHDTDNLHIHIAISKIHPVRYTIHHPYNDYKTLGSICETLEREFGLERDNHQARKSTAENRAADMERHAGIESLLGWIKRECIGQFREAQSWAQLHQVMRSNGLELHERGAGLVITAGDGTTVKASSIGRDCAKGRLEERFGPFEQSPERQAGEAAARKYEQKPMRPARDGGMNTAELYAMYKNEQQDLVASRSVLWDKARARKKRLIEAAKRSGRLKRAAIKLVKGAGPGKKLMYAMTSKTLIDDIGKINRQYLLERQEIHDKCRRRAWADWLRARALAGDQVALAALRARDATLEISGDTLTGKGLQKPAAIHPQQDSITKKGTIIRRAGTASVRDDGDKLTISRGAGQDGLQAALRMAMERYGDCISIQGTAAFKEQVTRAAAAARLPVTFDDAILERRRQELLQRPTQAATQPTAQPAIQPATAKESRHEQSDQSDQFEQAGRRRPAGSSVVRTGPDAARTAASGQKGRTGYAGTRTAGRARKPDIGRIGKNPPPQGQNRLRSLSELGVVRIASGGEVLLPGHVPGHMEQQGAAATDGVRRAVPGPGRLGQPGQLSAALAADQYIVEREQKRLKGFDIPKHAHYHEHDGPAEFAGIRHIGGQTLALLRHGGEIMVLPIDDAAARRLKRLAVGDAVAMTAQGSIRTKGRSR
jgi:hypothetical protein